MCLVPILSYYCTIQALPADTVVASDTSLSQGENIGMNDSSAIRSDTDRTVIPGKTHDTDSGITDLGKIVVTATRTVRKVSDIPASVTAIPRSEIEMSPAKNIDDLIMGKASVQLRRTVGIGEGIPSDIIIRGIPGALASSRMLVLVDGIPTNASGTPFLILNEVPIEAIKQVEIVRGPYSALYGANAFSGVINVLTLEGYGRPGIAANLETSLPFTGLNYYLNPNHTYTGNKLLTKSFDDALWNGTGVSSGGNEKYSYLVTGGVRSIGNYYQSDSILFRKGDWTYHKPARNYDYRDKRFIGKGTYDVNDRMQLTMHGRYFSSELGFGKTKSSDDTSDIITVGEKILVGPYLKYKATDWADFRIGGFYRRVNGTFYNEDIVDTSQKVPKPYLPSYWGSCSNDLQLEGQAILGAGNWNTITAGVDYLRNAINFGATKTRTGDRILRNGTDTSITNIGTYVQDEIGKFLGFRAVPGMRLDYHSLYGMTFSPKVGVVWNLYEPLQVRSSAGRAFRAPATSELFMPDLTINPTFVIRSNPDLRPETNWAIDGGVGYDPFPWLHLQVDLFRNRMKDLIVPQLGSSASDLMAIMMHLPEGENKKGLITHKNVSEATSQGIECIAGWRMLEWMSADVNYTYNNTRDATYDLPLDYIPSHEGSAALSFTKKPGGFVIKSKLTENYVGPRGFLNWQAPIDNTTLQGEKRWEFIFEGNEVRYIKPPYNELPDYWRTDAVVKCEFQTRYSLGFTAQNLFNANFEESPGSMAPKRMMSLEFGVVF